MSDPAVIDVAWPGAVRIIRSRFPPIDLFEDIADPRDWPLIIAAEMKTNPRLAHRSAPSTWSHRTEGSPAKARAT